MIDDLIKTLREIKRTEAKMAKLREVDFESVTRKRWENVRGDLAEAAMYREKLTHKAHALAVDLGIAEPRYSYDKITMGDGWRQYEYQPPVPESVKEAESWAKPGQ